MSFRITNLSALKLKTQTQSTKYDYVKMLFGSLNSNKYCTFFPTPVAELIFEKKILEAALFCTLYT